MQCMFLMLLSIYFIFFKFFQLCELRTSRRTQFTCIHYQQKVLDHRIEMYLHTKFHRSTNHFQIIHCCRWLWHHFVWFFFLFHFFIFRFSRKKWKLFKLCVCVFLVLCRFRSHRSTCDAIGELEGIEGADVYCQDACIKYNAKCPTKKCRCY